MATHTKGWKDFKTVAAAILTSRVVQKVSDTLFSY